MLPVLRRTIKPGPASHRRRCIRTQRRRPAESGHSARRAAAERVLGSSAPAEAARARLDRPRHGGPTHRSTTDRVPGRPRSLVRQQPEPLVLPTRPRQLRQRDWRRNEPLVQAIQMMADALDTPSEPRRRNLGVCRHTLLPTRSAARDQTATARIVSLRKQPGWPNDASPTHAAERGSRHGRQDLITVISLGSLRKFCAAIFKPLTCGFSGGAKGFEPLTPTPPV